MASSAQKPHHHHHLNLPTPFGTTAAPPPTPSNLSSDSTTPDFLSHILHRLPPSLSLSLPTRRSSSSTTPPIISLSDPTPSLHSALLSASTQLGFFHLTHHSIPSHLPLSAEATALSLFPLPHNQKKLLFPSNWPLGHEIDDDDVDGDTTSAVESFCLDSSFSTESTNELNFDSLREFSREMEKLGLKVLEELASAVGFDNPARNDLCSQLWISDGVNKPGRVYPYAVGLHYQKRCQKQSLLSDSGRVTVSGLADSVFVTLGDIAQVWSNGKVKKVRGRAFPVSSSDGNPNLSECIRMSLLITLPVESSVVCPLIPGLITDEDEEKRLMLFNPFSFEDYAWTVYHQRLYLKDPLLRYRA
ncbi:hypothetical protein C2S52_020193 [Perilla frutescens var. hirtella]|nr:hypothetical protein C2S52_020193 [Perilla frutescens var. hirtella]